MARNIVTYVILFIILVLMQVLVCNRIMLFGVATPIIFIYFLLRLPMDTPIKAVLLISFLTGLTVDIFSDTPGVNALSCTLLAVLRKPMFVALSGKDEDMENVTPCVSTLGAALYCKYLFTFSVFYCFLVIGLEYFTFTGIGHMLLLMLCSSVLSFVLMLGVDSLTAVSKSSS